MVFTIPGFHPGEDVVTDYVAGIVGQLGGSTFQVREVVLNVILELIEDRRETFVECLTDLGVSIVDRKMAEQVTFEIINGVQADKVDPNGVMEVFEVYLETEITCISSLGDNISFAGIQIRIQSGHKFNWQLGTEGFNGSEIFLFTFCELLIVGTKKISQIRNNAFTHHEVSNFIDRFHINQSF